jgi:hypothetical protein
MYESEMNVAIEQRKAMYVHIKRVHSPYICCLIRLCSVSSVHSANLKILEGNNVTVVLVILPS